MSRTTTPHGGEGTGHVFRKKELFDYESRVRIDKRTHELSRRNNQYIAAHPDITLVLHDILQHLLIHKPEDPLTAIQEYATARLPPAVRERKFANS